jgi:hypothetical protein
MARRLFAHSYRAPGVPTVALSRAYRVGNQDQVVARERALLHETPHAPADCRTGLRVRLRLKIGRYVEGTALAPYAEATVDHVLATATPLTPALRAGAGLDPPRAETSGSLTLGRARARRVPPTGRGTCRRIPFPADRVTS